MNTDLDGDIDVEASGEFDSDFTLLSVRSIIAFFTFFGWTGVLILNAGGSTITAVSFAALAGLVAMAIVGYLIYLFSRLSEDGNVDINNALLNVGKVYLTIPAEEAGQGKIHITIDGSMKELNAITKNMEELPTGSKIRVIEVLDNNILIVEPIEKLLE
jgi:membrane protein implicated in regulation of membrane protease activity